MLHYTCRVGIGLDEQALIQNWDRPCRIIITTKKGGSAFLTTLDTKEAILGTSFYYGTCPKGVGTTIQQKSPICLMLER